MCPICSNYFVSTTTEILITFHETEVIDIGVTHSDECSHMFHIICVTTFRRDLESSKCPRCDSIGLFLDCQPYNEKNDMLKDIYIPNLQRDTIEGNNVGGNDNDTTITAGSSDGDGVGDDNDNDHADININNNNNNNNNNDKW